MDTDRNLLFGVIALQLDLIDRDGFAEACAAWASHKSTPLADLMVERGWLAAADRDEVERVLRRRLDRRQGDVKASLQQTVNHVQPPIAGIEDAEIARSLAPHTPPEGLVLVATIDHQPDTRSRYTLTRLHAQGGVGQIWLARDASLGRDVALKELRPERAANPEAWARFLKEAQITGQLEHPGIVPIYELGRMSGNDQPFYTMRFVRGRTLTEAIRYYHERRQRGEAGALELRDLLRAFVGVCNAVAYAHSRRVIHRDLKPSNVVLGDFGEVMVLDWGLAKVMGGVEPGQQSVHPPQIVELPTEMGETVAGQLLGTPAYMAPEQADGRPDLLDARTDVYGLGSILYELLTGQMPFTGASTADVLQRVRHEMPVRPSRLVRPTPRPLEAICLKAIAKASADRYQSAEAVARDVDRWLADEPVEAYPDPLTVRVGRLLRRYRTAVVAAVVLLFTITVTVSLAMVLLSQAYGERALALKEAKDKAVSEEVAHTQADKATGQAVRALSTLVNKVQEYIRDTGGMRPLRQALLKEAMSGFSDIARELAGQPLVDPHVATAYQHMSYIATELGDAGQARTFMQRSIEINERVAEANPDNPRALIQLGISLSTGAVQLEAQGGDLTLPREQLERALAVFYKALATAKKHPGDPDLATQDAEAAFDPFTSEPFAIERRRAHCLDHLGEIAQRQGNLKTAKTYYLEALEIHRKGLSDIPQLAASVMGLLATPGRHSPLLAIDRLVVRADLNVAFFVCLDNVTRSQNLLGEVALREGDVERMHSEFLASIELAQALRRLDPGSLHFRWNLVTNIGRHAELCISTGELDRAEENGRLALRLARDMRDSDPGSAGHDAQVALQHYRLGVIADRKGQRDGALAHFNECLRIRTSLARYQPSNQDFQKQVMLSLPRVGRHEEAALLADKALKEAGKNGNELVEIATVYAMCIPEVGRGKPAGALTESEQALQKRYTEKALAILRQAAGLGFSDWGYLQIEVDLDGLRPHPEFKAIVEQMKRAGK
jgi:tetratricopeptide (TPR) repeat protein